MYQIMVKRASQNELSIGWELHEGNRRIFVVNEGLQTMPSSIVPDSAQAIVATGNDQRAVPVEVDSRDGIRVRRQGLQALAGLHIP